MKNILCYGDSNTWGYIPGGMGRYDWQTRWPGVLQRELGEGYRIIENGLNGRTTVFDCPIRGEMLNGKKQLDCALLCNAPLDLVVLMLGTNDLQLGLDAWHAASGSRALAKIILNNALQFTDRKPRVLLVSPILVGENIAAVDQSPIAISGHQQSKLFAEQYAQVAASLGTGFLDAAQYAEPDDADCEHMDAAGHRRLGTAMAEKVREMLG